MAVVNIYSKLRGHRITTLCKLKERAIFGIPPIPACTGITSLRLKGTWRAYPATLNSALTTLTPTRSNWPPAVIGRIRNRYAAKCICTLLDPNAKAENINHYRALLRHRRTAKLPVFHQGNQPVVADKHKHRLSELRVYVPRYNLECIPWKLAQTKTLTGAFYNKVKLSESPF